MIRRVIPGTEILVPPVCLGTMTFGTPVGEDDAVRLVHRAFDRGVDFIDTANMYEGYARYAGSAGGVAERIVGRAVKGARHRYVIATKLGMKVGDAPEDQFTSPAAIRRQLDRSLSLLGTDYVDVYYLHRYDPATPPEEIVQAMDRERAAGRIRCYAVSNYAPDPLAALLAAADRLGLPRPALCQPPLSLLRPDALQSLVPLCASEGLGVVPYQILEGGLLTGKYRRGAAPPAGSRAEEKPDWVRPLDDAFFDRLDAIAADAAAEGLPMLPYAILWALRQPAVLSAIVGAKRGEQIDAAVDAAERLGAAPAGRATP